MIKHVESNIFFLPSVSNISSSSRHILRYTNMEIHDTSSDIQTWRFH